MAQNGAFDAAKEAVRSADSAKTEPNISGPSANNASPSGGPNLQEQLQPPVLAAGEKLEDFWSLAQEVWDALLPKTFLERLEASDVCHALWEERRFRRYQTALPRATGLKALQCLLAAIGFEQKALTIATDYFGVEGQERDQATALLRRYDIDDDAIAAQASEHNLPTISALERLMANRQSRRDTIVKHYQRRQRKSEKPKVAEQSEPARNNDNSAPPKKDAA